MKRLLQSLTLGALAALAVSGSAQALVTFTSTPFDGANGPNEQTVVDFDNPNAPGYVVTYAPGAAGVFITPLVPGVAAPPVGDTTHYLSVFTGAVGAKLTTPKDIETLSLYIGSIDTYNTITFKNSLGAVVASYTGLQLFPPADGNQFDASTNRRFYFNFGDTPIDEVDFVSSGNSFEFDNIAVSAVPEPGVWALLIAGFGIVGGALRGRRRTLAASA